MTTGSGVYQLTFHQGMYDSPILQKLGKTFRVSIAIRRAMLSEDGGWAEVKLTGLEEEIGRAVAELQTTGVGVSGPLEITLEPDAAAKIVGVGRGT